MTALIIDDSGRFSDAASASLRSQLHAWPLGDTFSDYVVRNLGFIEVVTQARAARIKMRPAVTSPAAFAALMYWLADHPFPRVMLSRLEDEWRHEVIGDSRTATLKLVAMMRRAADDRTTDFLRTPLDAGKLDESSPLLRLIRLRAELGRDLEFTRLEPVLNTALKGRFTICSADRDLTTLSIDAVGRGFAHEANYWLHRAVGTRLEDGPDQAFGAWASSDYRHVLKVGLSMLDDIDVVVDWPQLGRRRYCYKRLLVPLDIVDGRMRLLCATLQDRGIDLRAGCG
ncbi:MAG: hypothetical protein ABL898_01470 [Hyphomicrobiaceae bacterium]|nr:hypothetical protein [Hyphomicrobiaceae bacterium]